MVPKTVLEEKLYSMDNELESNAVPVHVESSPAKGFPLTCGKFTCPTSVHGNPDSSTTSANTL